jgi:ABC-type transport system substrate-binding protein
MLRLGMTRWLTALVAVALLAAACGGSKGGGTSHNNGNAAQNNAAAAGEKNILPATGGTPPSTASGTLVIVGSGDVDKLDTCCAYYTTTYELLRMVSRQLVSYPAGLNNSEAAPVADLATYSISSDGLTYTFHIKQGVMWDAPSGPRQITAQDEVLGLKRLCNPVNPAPPLPYWTGNIVGMQAFCGPFQKLKLATAPSAEIAQIRNYINSNNISGVTTPNSSTVVIKLMRPSSSFINIMSMPMSSPVPIEILNYLPGSVQEEEHFISDGPYTITKYTPNVSYTLVDNPAWQQSTDNLRHRYFQNVKITEGLTATAVQQQLQTGDADLEWDTTVPTAQVQQMVNAHDPHLVIAFLGGITYLVFNMKSPALKSVAVRKALQYCVNKRHIIQVSGGPAINVASDQILTPQMTVGYKHIDPYATPNNQGNPSKCKSMLAAAGAPNLTLTLVYPNNPPAPAQATALQSDFAQAGVTLKFNEQPSQGEYFNYIETPGNQGKWDLAFGAWFPDWQGNAAQTYFSPLFDGRLLSAASNGTNYGQYNDPTVNGMIDQALHAATTAKAGQLWANLDNYIMTQDPGWIPLVDDALPQYVGINIHNPVFNGFTGYVDPTSVWK